MLLFLGCCFPAYYAKRAAKISVRISDENDAPTYSGKTFTVNVVEETADTNLLDVRAFDEDPPLKADNSANPWGVLTYKLVGAPPGITVNLNSGMLAIDSSFDYETTKFRTSTFSVVAHDLGTGTDTSAITTARITVNIVDKNDNLPTLDPQYKPSSYNRVVTEEAVLNNLYMDKGVLPLVIAAKDKDSSLNDNDKVTFEIIKGDTAPPHFAIEQHSGAVTLIRKLDYEAKRLFSLVVRVSEVVNNKQTVAPKNESEVAFTITVADVDEFAPEWIHTIWNYTYYHNVSPPEVLVSAGKLAKDDDLSEAMSNLTFTITGQGRKNFVLDPKSGMIMIKKGVSGYIKESPTSYGSSSCVATADVVLYGRNPRLEKDVIMSKTLTVTSYPLYCKKGEFVTHGATCAEIISTANNVRCGQCNQAYTYMDIAQHRELRCKQETLCQKGEYYCSGASDCKWAQGQAKKGQCKSCGGMTFKDKINHFDLDCVKQPFCKLGAYPSTFGAATKARACVGGSRAGCA